MNFKVGSVVVYPKQGVVKILGIKNRDFHGKQIEYLILESLDTKVQIQIPKDKVHDLGLHPIIDKEKIEKILTFLSKPFKLSSEKWSRRYKVNSDRLVTREIDDVVEIVRDLTERDLRLKISPGEKNMLIKARKIMILEFLYALGKTEEETEKLINDALNLSDEYVAALHKYDISS